MQLLLPSLRPATKRALLRPGRVGDDYYLATARRPTSMAYQRQLHLCAGAYGRLDWGFDHRAPFLRS